MSKKNVYPSPSRGLAPGYVIELFADVVIILCSKGGILNQRELWEKGRNISSLVVESLNAHTYYLGRPRHPTKRTLETNKSLEILSPCSISEATEWFSPSPS